MRVKVTAALRILAYGLPPDDVDEYLAMSETTARITLKRFCSAVVKTLGPIYLRDTTADDIKKMLKEGDGRCTLRHLGSIDCCKWEWEELPEVVEQAVKREGK